MTSRLVDPISRNELQRRWALAQQVMQTQQLDVLVIQNSNNHMGGYVRWFTGMPALYGYPRAVLFFGVRDMIVIEQGARGGDRTPDQSDDSMFGVTRYLTSSSFTTVSYTADTDALIAARAIRERGTKRIGWINPAGAYFGFGKALEEHLSDHHFKDVTDLIDESKAIKSAEEQVLLRRTAALQDQVIADVAGFLKPGLQDFEVAAFAQYRAQALGSEQGIFLGSSNCSGKAAVFLPRYAQGREIGAGDVFSLLVEVNGPGGLYTEIARTYSLGKPSDALIEANHNAVAAQAHTLAMLRPGTPCADIYARHNAYMIGRGLPPEDRLYAHGQGYEMVERPLIRDDETMIVREGMNFAVHPGYVCPEAFAVVCDNYLIEAAGPSALHKTAKSIIQI